MGLLTVIRKQKRKDRELRCLLLGLDNSGKSTIVNKLSTTNTDTVQEPNGILPTAGFHIHSIKLGSRLVTIWDVGGQKTLRPFWSNYFDSTDILLWCIDTSSPIRYQESLNELFQLINYLQDNSNIALRKHRKNSIAILLNKMDLLTERTSIDELKSVVNNTVLPQNMREIPFIEMSAITGDGLNNLQEFFQLE